MFIICTKRKFPMILVFDKQYIMKNDVLKILIKTLQKVPLDFSFPQASTSNLKNFVLFSFS